MATLITIAVGSSVGLVCRRFAAAHPFGALTDMLLGITGAFAGVWFTDVLRQMGVNFDSYSWMFVLCGAALLPLSFHGFYGHGWLQRPWVSRQDTQEFREKMASQKVDSRKNDAPSA